MRFMKHDKTLKSSKDLQNRRQLDKVRKVKVKFHSLKHSYFKALEKVI